MSRTTVLVMTAALGLPAPAAAGQAPAQTGPVPAPHAAPAQPAQPAPPPPGAPPTTPPAGAAPPAPPVPPASVPPYTPSPPYTQPYPPNAQPYPPYAQPYPPNAQPYPPYAQPYPPYSQPYPYPYPPPAPPPPPLAMAPEEMPPDEPGRYDADKKSRFHNPALFGVGIALTSLGGGSIFVGVITMVAFSWAGTSSGETAGPAVVAIVGGAVLLAAGIPMIVIGGKRRGPNMSTTPRKRAPPWLGAPHGAGWAWTF